MTVADLIALLEECDHTAEVSLTGCDCTNDWCGHVAEGNGYVILLAGLDTLGSLECQECS